MEWVVLHKSSDNIASGVVGKYKYFMVFVCVCVTATTSFLVCTESNHKLRVLPSIHDQGVQHLRTSFVFRIVDIRGV
jgi:hypothetical protein